MGALLSHCAVMWAQRKDRVIRKKAQTRGRRCINILKDAEVHLCAMQTKYQAQLGEVDEAMQTASRMPSASAHDKQVRKDRLLELLRKRKVLRHYLAVCIKRNNQVKTTPWLTLLL